jgi:hypothetical protein
MGFRRESAPQRRVIFIGASSALSSEGSNYQPNQITKYQPTTTTVTTPKPNEANIIYNKALLEFLGKEVSDDR